MWKLATIALLLVAGCSDDARVSVGVGGHWEPPVLLEVGVVDTFGVDSEVPGAPVSVLDPFSRGGWFELYWYVDADTDYRTSVRLSRSGVPGVGRSGLIGEFRCGRYEPCYDSGSLYCRYTRDFEIGCGFTAEDADYYLMPIADLMDQVPADLFLEVTTCDSRGRNCDDDVVPVRLR